MFYFNNYAVAVQDTKPKNHYEIFLNCNNFKKLTGDLVSGKIEFDFKDFCFQYYYLFNNKFLEKYESNGKIITSISFEKPYTLNIRYNYAGCGSGSSNKYRITNLQEISEILSEMAKKFEKFAERYKEISNSLDEFEL